MESNGFATYGTHLVALVLDNDQPLHTRWYADARRTLRRYRLLDALTLDLATGCGPAAVGCLATRLRTEAHYEVRVIAADHAVDWRDLAEHILHGAHEAAMYDILRGDDAEVVGNVGGKDQVSQ